MKLVYLVAALSTLSVLPAQTSSTLPKNFDKQPGNQRFWAGFDVNFSSRQASWARAVSIYDKAAFPWGNKVVVITKLSVRRYDAEPAGATDAHTKKMRMWVSSNGAGPRYPDMGSWVRNHGANRTLVLGTTAAPKTVSFPATARGNPTAPFNVVFALDKPFLIKGGETSLSIEWASYGASITNGRFLADCWSQSGASRNWGKGTTLGKQCLSPPAALSSGGAGAWIGGSYRQRLTAGRPNLTFVGMLGTRRSSPIPIPGTGNPPCELLIDPVFFTTGRTGSLTAGLSDHVFAPIPVNQAFVGASLAVQSAFLDKSANALGVGISTGRDYQIGSGQSASAQIVTVYSYADQHVGHNGKNVDPDNTPYPRAKQDNRAPIWKIN